jgi:hypothetical protein
MACACGGGMAGTESRGLAASVDGSHADVEGEGLALYRREGVMRFKRAKR